MRKYFAFIFLILTFSVFSQDSTIEQNRLDGANIGFSNIFLGMSREEVSQLLSSNKYFNYRGEQDVVFSPVEKQPVIRCAGAAYVKRAFFYFQDEVLFSITLMLDEKVISRFTLTQNLSEKYGLPQEVTPKHVLWNSEKHQISIEEPLSVKYLDKDLYFKRLSSSQVREADRIIDLEKFYQEF